MKFKILLLSFFVIIGFGQIGQSQNSSPLNLEHTFHSSKELPEGPKKNNPTFVYAGDTIRGRYYPSEQIDGTVTPFIKNTEKGIPDVIMAPANDNCGSATNLGTVSTTTTVAGTNVTATGDLLNPTCYNTCRQVWYSFTVPAGGGTYSFTAAGGTISWPDIAVIQFSTPCVLSGAVQKGCAYSINGTSVSMSISCMAAGTYYIMVDDDGCTLGGASGSFNLTVCNNPI